jgi:hypothetical protein
MNKMIAVAVVFLILVTAKIMFKDNNPNLQSGMPPMPTAMAKPEAGACIPIDRFMADHPEATLEEMAQMEQCNKDRAVKLGLDKRNTGFLGNRNIRPEGSLAHYEGGYGSFVFTLYQDRIVAKDAGDDVEIDLASIKSVKKSASAMVIEYQTASGGLKHYGVTLLGSDDSIKTEGNTDLDRLIDLVNRLRAEA